MFTAKIPQHTQDLLGILADQLPAETYLAGGTGLALHLNHRKSFDLDFYTREKFESKMVVQQWEAEVPKFELISTAWQTIIGISQDTEISLFYYKYPLLCESTVFRGVSVASVSDIACMKLEAIGGRGLKRDFYDLYTICQLDDWSLEKVVELNREKYGRKQTDLPHIFKSLVYFDEVELSPERAEITEVEWKEIKEYFVRQTKVLVGKGLK